MSKGWIGVDLDGTLAMHYGWEGEMQISEPVPQMLRRVKNWIAQGIEVRIVTARAFGKSDGHPVIIAIQNWCVTNGLPPLRVTCSKDYEMIELWDDRAVQVISNTGIAVRAPR